MSATDKLNSPCVTVAVCTYNRSFILKESLDSLIIQNTPLDHFELLIIDNNSNDDTQKVAAQFCAQIPNSRVIFEPQQGLSYARNRALAEAHSPWVAFLDDDARAHPNWIATILETISKDDFDAFGGPYYAWHCFGPPPTWFPTSEGTYLGSPAYGSLGTHHIPGGNCAFKRQAALAAGGFPAEMGMTGNKCAYGEETYLFNSMKVAGYRLGFVPDMSIDHCVLPYKYQLRWQLASAFASGRDAFYVFKKKCSWREFFRIWWAGSKAFCKLAYACCSIWKTRQRKLVYIEAYQLATNIGSLYSFFRMLLAR